MCAILFKPYINPKWWALLLHPVHRWRNCPWSKFAQRVCGRARQPESNTTQCHCLANYYYYYFFFYCLANYWVLLLNISAVDPSPISTPPYRLSVNKTTQEPPPGLSALSLSITSQSIMQIAPTAITQKFKSVITQLKIFQWPPNAGRNNVPNPHKARRPTQSDSP